MSQMPEQLRNLSPEAKARQSSGNTSAKGKAGRAASPWSRGPMCDTPNAGRSFQRVRKAAPK